MTSIGAILPRVSFPRRDGPGTVALNNTTTATVVFVPHRHPCAACAAYLGELGAALGGLQEWATRAVVLMPAGLTASAERGVTLLDDASGVGRARLGIDDDQAAVIQADRWGAVYQAKAVGPEPGSHVELPAPHELVGLAKFIDIQCPECEVPSKEWLAASPFPLG